MMPEELKAPSDLDLKTLLYQALALEYTKFQKREANTQKKDKWWITLAQSTLLATLITVLFGTIGGAVIANRIQEKSKSTEDQRAEQNALGIARQHAVEQAFTTVGQTVASCQEIIDISGESWNEERPGISSEIRKLIINEKQDSWRGYKSAIGTWRVQREQLGLQLAERHNDSSKIMATWEKLSAAVEAFGECAGKFNGQAANHPVSEATVNAACKSDRENIRDGLRELTELTIANADQVMPKK